MAIKNTYIHLIDYGILNLSSDVPVPITKSVAEVQDITAKNSSFSKTIVVPGTKSNNAILGNLFDINATEGTFDINRKVNCFIYSDGVPVLKGYFRLTAVRIISPSSPTDLEQIEYDTLVFDQATNFYDKLGDNLLESLDLSQYDHQLSYEAIKGQTSASANTVYPMHFSTNASYTTSDFWPAIYVKTYIDKMFETYNYSYESNFFSSNEDFTKLIIPYNSDSKKVSLASINTRKFRSQIVSGTNITQLYGSLTSNLFGGNIIPFNNDSATGNFDSGGTFNTTTYTYTSPSNQQTSFNARIPVRLKVYSPSGATFTASSSGVPTLQVKVSSLFVKNGSGSFQTTSTPYVKYISPGFTLNPGYQYITSTFYIDASCIFDDSNAASTLKYGDTVSIKTDIQTINTSNSGFMSGSTFVNPILYIELDSTGTTTDNNYFYNTPYERAITEGDTVFVNDYIPKNVKMKDVFKSLVQAFNLFIETDDENENKLIIKTREEYYSGSTFVDWTDKLAIDSEHSFKFLPELQNRDFLLTYKKSDDFLNKQYFEATNEVYGQQKFTFDNDFIKGEKKLELIFEPTPLLQNNIRDQYGNGMIVPYLLASGPKSGLKLLYYNGWIPGNSWKYTYKTTGGTTTSSIETTYPYSGHFNDPIYPSKDFGFGEPLQLFYSNYGALTDNTLANRYYYDYVQQIIEGKMFVGMFDLNAVDINNIRFNDKVFIKDSFYYINKIIDFDANSNSLTKVELIKTNEGISKFATTNHHSITFGRPIGEVTISLPSTVEEVLHSTRPFLPNISVTNTSNSSPNIFVNTLGNGNTVGDLGGGVVVGDINVIGGRTTFFAAGSGNTITGNLDGVVIGGNDNFTQGSSTLIIGNSNTATTSNIFIVGEGISGTTPNTIYTTNVSTTNINGLTFSALTANTYMWSSSTGTNSIIANNGSGNLASGTNSFAVGTRNTSSGNYSSIGGGSGNTASFTSGFIGGGSSNRVSLQYSGIVAGLNNKATSNNNFIGAGRSNYTSGGRAFVISGKENSASTENSGVLSGYRNSVSGLYSIIGSGKLNSATTTYSTIVNGYLNLASGVKSFIANGGQNTTSGSYSFVGNGQGNTASGTKSFIGGGLSNIVSGAYSTIVGGRDSIASATGSFVGGGARNKALAQNSGILAGSNNTATTNYSVIVGGQYNFSSGGTHSIIGSGQFNTIKNGKYSVIGGGAFNTLNSYSYSSIGGGSLNTITGVGSSFIGGGASNIITYGNSFIGGGSANNVLGSSSSVVGGNGNYATGIFSIVGGGQLNTASGNYSIVGGGFYNLASGNSSAIIGGRNNGAVHTCSVAMGGGSQTRASFDFVLGATSGSTSNVANNTIRLQGTGGNIRIDGAVSSPEADYSEYFEWSDGNPNNEDRNGFFVSLIGDKIVKSNLDVIGVVSCSPSFIGDDSHNKWNKMYLRDNWNKIILDENGEPVLNPDYDPNIEYKTREERKEWSPIGLLGKLRVRTAESITSSKIDVNIDGYAINGNTYRVLDLVKEYDGDYGIIRILLK